jgi:hypothetical protein
MSKTSLAVSIALAVTIGAPACSAAHIPLAESRQQSVAAGVTAAPTPPANELDDDAFCRAARQTGISNEALAAESADPAALLPAIDQLVPVAPPAIRDDFTTFDHLEHAILDPTHQDQAAMQNLDQPATRDALKHVGDYLSNTCHITS